MSIHPLRLEKQTSSAPLVSGEFLQRQMRNTHITKTLPVSRSNLSQSTGEPLDADTRGYMESHFNHNFGQVRVHNNAHAARSARSINARAYTVQNDIVFGDGEFQPQSKSGKRLIAHELAHVVQQESSGNSVDVNEAEARSRYVAELVSRNQSVSRKIVGSAPSRLYADNGEEETTAATPSIVTRPAFSLGWGDLSRIGAFGTTPSLLSMRPRTRLSLGSPILTSPSLVSGVPRLPPPTLFPSSGGLDFITPPVGTSAETEAVPSLPSRLPIVSHGQFSLGLRLGFPDLTPQALPGMPEPLLSESLRRARLVNQLLTGNVPSGWEAVDKNQLAQAIWGIFSTNIAPDIARSITSGLSTPAGPAGVSYELDLVLISDFSSEIGGGLSFTVRFPSFQSLFTRGP